MSTTNRQQYGMNVRNAANLPEDFIRTKTARIDLAWQTGEPPEMLADELRLLYSLRRPAPTKTPRQLAKRIMRIHDNTMTALGWWANHSHYDRDGYCDNPCRGY